MVKAFFAGSFNPFTIGHASIVERALTMFDSVVIGIGFNAAKAIDAEAVRERVSMIARLYRDDRRVRVTAFDTLAVKAARHEGCTVLLRGVRSVADFEYERNMADINRQLPEGMETVLLYALPEYAAVSSSVVRELASYGVDTTPYLPKNTNVK